MAARPVAAINPGQRHSLDAGRPSGNNRKRSGSVPTPATKYQVLYHVAASVSGQSAARWTYTVVRPLSMGKNPTAPTSQPTLFSGCRTRISVPTVAYARNAIQKGSSPTQSSKPEVPGSAHDTIWMAKLVRAAAYSTTATIDGHRPGRVMSSSGRVAAIARYARALAFDPPRQAGRRAHCRGRPPHAAPR